MIKKSQFIIYLLPTFLLSFFSYTLHAFEKTGIESVDSNIKSDTSINKTINWDDLNPRAVGFVKDYLAIHEIRLEKMKAWSSPYFLLIENILKKYRLPASLKYLAVIESDLQSNALSSAGALGPWQLMPETARELGLTVNTIKDDRTDLNKSTHAAAKYLLQLYENLGDWLLVIAAYNGGPARLENIIKKRNSRDFWMIQNNLPVESQNHVKKFIATHYIFEKDGSETTGKTTVTNSENLLTESELLSSDTINISGKYSGLVISKSLGIDYTRFSRWNPEFDKKVGSSPYLLRLPKETIPVFRFKKNQILQESVLLLIQQNIDYGSNFPEPIAIPKIVKPTKSTKK